MSSETLSRALLQTKPNIAEYLYFGLFLLWLIQAPGKMFSLIKDSLVPEVEPEAGFHYFPLKKWNFPETTTGRLWTEPHSFAGHLSTRALWRGSGRLLPAESWATVLHAGQTGQRLTVKRVHGLVLIVHSFSENSPFVVLSGEEQTVSESKGRCKNSVQIRCVSGPEGRPSAPLLAGAHCTWAWQGPGPAWAGLPTYRHLIRPLNTWGPKGNHTLPLQTWTLEPRAQ